MTSPSGPTGKSPSSKARWVSSGGMTLSAAPMSTSTTVTTSAALCGANSSEMRRKRCGIFGASAFSARCADSSAEAMRVRALPYLPRLPARRARVHAHALKPKRRMRRRRPARRARVPRRSLQARDRRPRAHAPAALSRDLLRDTRRGLAPRRHGDGCHVLESRVRLVAAVDHAGAPRHRQPVGTVLEQGQVVVEPRALHRVPTERRIGHVHRAGRQRTDRGRHAVGHDDGEPAQQPRKRIPHRRADRLQDAAAALALHLGQEGVVHVTRQEGHGLRRWAAFTVGHLRRDPGHGLEAVLEGRPVLEVDRLSQPFADPRGRSPPRALGDGLVPCLDVVQAQGQQERQRGGHEDVPEPTAHPLVEPFAAPGHPTGHEPTASGPWPPASRRRSAARRRSPGSSSSRSRRGPRRIARRTRRARR